MQYLHESDVGLPEMLAADLRSPVLLADEPLHRRVSVHYLWLPPATSPEVHRDLAHVLELCLSHGFTEIAIVQQFTAAGAQFWRLTLQPTTKGSPDG